MDNQHRKIKGYRELNQDEIDLMNEIKQKGVELGELHAKVMKALDARDEGGLSEINVNGDVFRWASIGKTNLQTGLMALTRAVAAPEFF